MIVRRQVGRALVAIAILFVQVIGMSQTSASIRLPVPALRLGDDSAAAQEKRLREALKGADKDPHQVSELARLLYRRGQVADAKKFWDYAAARDANLARGDVEVIHELLDSGDLGASQTALERAQQKYPKDPHVLLAAGQVSMRKGDVASAKAQFESAFNMADNLAVTNLTLGQFYETVTRDRNIARPYYERGARAAPKRPEGWLLLAGADFADNKIESALEYLRSAEKCDSLVAEARLARMYFDAEDYVGAYRWFAKAAKRSPDDKLIGVRVGQMLLVLRRQEQAETEFRRVLAMDADYVPALIALGQLLEVRGEYTESEDLYRRTLRVESDNVVANNNLAMLLFQQEKEPDQAMQLATKARELSSSTPETLATLGCAQVLAGKHEDAVQSLSQASRLLPNDPWVRYGYARALLGADRKAECREQFEACLLLDEDFPKKEQVSALLQRLVPPSTPD